MNVISIGTSAYVANSLYRMNKARDIVLFIQRDEQCNILYSFKAIQRYILDPSYAKEGVKLAKFGMCLQSVLATLNMALTLTDLYQTVDYLRNIKIDEYNSEIMNLQDEIDTAAGKISKTCEQFAKVRYYSPTL